MKKQENLVKMILSALFLALAYLMPFLTGQIQSIGNKLCPMHIPVILCGFICGWYWGLSVGFIAPLLRSFTLGMPILFPNAVAMAVELAVYGMFSGLMYKIFPKKKIYIYPSLLISMISGRIVWGFVMYVLMGLKGSAFTLKAFYAGAFLNALPGIVIQIILIPVLVMIFDFAKKSRGRI